MSIARLSARAGYQYLLRHTASGDVGRDASTPLTAYYTEAGYPPGSWWGSGLTGLGDGQAGVVVGSLVTEDAMSRVFGAGRDPVTDRALGRPYPAFRPTAQRITDAIGALPAGLNDDERAAAVDAIERTEQGRRTRSAVAGFDLTFTVPKSASVLWALGDPVTQAAVADAHRAAVRDTLARVESRALFTRVGSRSCAQVPTRGMVAAVFDHWDTRAGDPNLHSHVVIANKVQGLDGLWRSLDSRALHHAAVAISEVYDNLFADHLARALPVSWSYRDRGPRRTPAWEVDGVPDQLLGEFSARSAAITAAMSTAVVDFHAMHGRAPTRVETTRLRQRMTLATRPAKTMYRLPELMAWWRRRAVHVLRGLPRHGLGALLPGLLVLRETADGATDHHRHSGRGPSPRRTSRRGVRRLDAGPSTTRRTAFVVRRDWSINELPAQVVDRLADATIAAVMERRSTWTVWNLLAEAARTTRPIRCRTVADRHDLHDRVVAAAVARCVCLEAPEVFTAPEVFRREDGTSVFARPGEDTYSHVTVLEAEARLLDALEDLAAPSADAVAAWSGTGALQPPREPGGRPVRLAGDQVDAVIEIATSGRRVEVLVGPAGTGKTTTLQALRTVWEAAHGAGSVTGLAPSATAAHELSAALGIGCENTAKWLHETTGPAGQQRDGLLARLRERHGLAMSLGDISAARRLARALQRVERNTDGWSLHPGQLLIVDEASLAGTLTLDALTAQARAAGAKLLLVGDHRQLSAVDAGGAFGLLATTAAARELTSLWRFSHRWEAHATRRLRHGDPAVLAAYEEHDRIREGSTDEILDAAYEAWAADQTRGLGCVLLAADSTTVAALNERAHSDRIADGMVDPATAVPAADATTVAVGDLVLTRRNDRRLVTSTGGHVRNGTRWIVTATHPDGSITATRAPDHGRANSPKEQVRLPGGYVRDHVELGYATTIHRAQGVTVHTAHVLVTPGTSREALYVAMTRGTTSNTLYVPLDVPDEACTGIPDPGAPTQTARDVLADVLARSDREKSATETLRQRQDSATSPRRLLPVRDTLQLRSPWSTTGARHVPEATPEEVEAALAEIDAVLLASRAARVVSESSSTAIGSTTGARRAADPASAVHTPVGEALGR